MKLSIGSQIGITLSVLVFWLASSVSYADEWPNQPVRIVVPFAPGGASDRYGRLIAADLSKVFKQQFYVENKSGGAGATASAEVAHSTPDGYTLVIAGMGPNITGPAINPHIGYEPIKDFVHIAMIGGDSTLFVVHPTLGVKSFSEFMRLAKTGVTTSVGSPGMGTVGHLSLEQFRRRAGLMNLYHIPYRGGGPLAIDLLGGHISAAFIGTGAGIEIARDRKVIPLAVTASERTSNLKDVPTFTELGYPDVEATTWGWLAGPQNLPTDVVDKLNGEVRRFIKTPEIQQRFKQESMQTRDMDSVALTHFLAGELKRWGALVQEAGLVAK